MEIDLDIHLPSVAARDAAAFGHWLAGAERPLRASLRPLAHRVDAEAVLQEALLRVWQVAPRFVPDGRPNALLRLAHRITRNLALDELRRARVQPLEAAAIELALAAALPVAADALFSDPLLRQTIAACRDELPAQPSRALTERIASAGAEPDDVLAARVGMTRNTFLQNFTRARKLLADCLQKHGVELPTSGAGVGR